MFEYLTHLRPDILPTLFFVSLAIAGLEFSKVESRSKEIEVENSTNIKTIIKQNDEIIDLIKQKIDYGSFDI